MSELLPCPFCGGEAAMQEGGFPFEVMIGCRTCFHRPLVNMMGTDSDDRIRQVAIEKWNTRATPWRPISEAPRDGTDILVYVPETRQQFVAYWNREHSAWTYALCRLGAICCEPTHYMPLPAPPSN